MIFVIGGGGGLSTNDALLHINAPVGSTITLVKGGVTVATLAANKGHTNSDGVTADWYYSVSSSNYGEWTVTASNGTYTATGSVAISTNKQYDLSLKYDLYFIENGVFKLTYTTYHMTVEEDAADGAVYITATGTYPKLWSQQLTASILNGGYSKVCIDVVSYTGGSNMQAGLSANNTATSSTSVELVHWAGKNITTLTHGEADLSGVQITDTYMKTVYPAQLPCVIKNFYLKR